MSTDRTRPRCTVHAPYHIGANTAKLQPLHKAISIRTSKITTELVNEPGGRLSDAGDGWLVKDLVAPLVGDIVNCTLGEEKKVLWGLMSPRDWRSRAWQSTIFDYLRVQRPFASATAIRCRQSSLSGRPRPLDTNEYLCVYKSYKRKRERGRIRVAWLAMQYIINEMLCLLLVLFPFRFVVGRADLCKYKRTLLL